MAVLATTTNATTNVMPGSPPASEAAAAAAADDGNSADNNDNDDNDGVNLDALHHRLHDLRRMLDASPDRLTDAKADAAVACVECVLTSELAERRAGERIYQVKEELRRTRIEAKRFRAGWTRLPAVGGRGRKRRAKGASASLSVAAAAAAAKAEQEI